MFSKPRASSTMKDKDPPRKKQKTNLSSAIEPISILSLPHDLLLNCLAFVSRLYYPTLSLVCQNFRAIIASLELYKTRSLLNRTESCLYFSLHVLGEPDVQWFTLCRKPNQNLTNKLSGYHLVPIPCAKPHYERMYTSFAVGSNIYIMGCDGLGLVLDCRTHKWHKAPSMRLDRCYYTASLVDGKIYVAGGYKNSDIILEWVEVFDPTTETWGSITNPGIRIHKLFGTVESFELGGKFYLFGDECMVYNPKEGRWDPVARFMSDAVKYMSYCVIDNIVLFISGGVFNWYDSNCKERLVKELHGVKELPDLCPTSYCKLVNLGGKMVVLWENFKYPNGFWESKNTIWCAEIALEKREGGEIWGNVEWFDAVLTLSVSHRFLNGNALSATL